jgi:hypothetical protein
VCSSDLEIPTLLTFAPTLTKIPIEIPTFSALKVCSNEENGIKNNKRNIFFTTQICQKTFQNDILPKNS